MLESARCRVRERFRGICDDPGFTIVEVLAALLVVSIVLLSFTYTLMSGYRALRDARNFQQATALGNEVIEAARDLRFDDLVMDNADVAADTARISTSCPGITGNYFFDPDGAPDPDLDCEEVVATAAGAGIPDHITSEVLNGTTFTRYVYVTWVRVDAARHPDPGGDSAADLKRITAIVDWTVNDTTKRFRTSTFLARARRGLPVPKFDLDPPGSSGPLNVQQGNQVVFAHTITNLGITDTYDLEMEIPIGRTWDVRFHEDVDGDGVFDYTDVNGDSRFTEGIDTALDPELTADTNATGVVDTGVVPTSDTTTAPDPGKFFFLAVWELSPAEAVGGPLTATITVTSGADPGVFEERDDLLTVTATPQPLRLYLHNFPTPPTANTTAQTNLPMTEAAPSASTLFNYSTNLPAQNPPVSQGRLVEKRTPNAVSETNNSATYTVNWVYQVPSSGTTILDGTARLRVFVSCGTTEFNVYLQHKANSTSNTGTQITAPQTVQTNPQAGCTDFFEVDTTWVVPRVTPASNRWIDLKLYIPGTGAANGGRFAYDTTTFPSSFTLPRVSS